MINLGLDFGSTYTMISAYNGSRPEVLQEINGSFTYPSVVTYDAIKNKYNCGRCAKDKSGKNIKTFSGFKMLLNQQMEPEHLESRGYDQENTPERITEEYLRFVITQALKKTHQDKVEKLVIGAPECWFQNLNTIDARSVLAEICGKLDDIVCSVQIVSEPASAAVFCAWNYSESKSKQLNGRILVIDYGGGTLDTALVEIRQINGAMQIKPQSRSGAGENHDNTIGNAGIAYQEEIARRAISMTTGMTEEEIPCDANFHSFSTALEASLISSSNDIEDFFSEIIGDIPKEYEQEEFASIYYKGLPISITYTLLKQVYDKLIRPVLKKVLDDTILGLDEDMSDVKIALVGGFSNYYLVKKQVYDYFSIGALDERISGMVQNESDREKAIAFGASLIADDVISVCNVAQYSIGYPAKTLDNKAVYCYAIKIGQELEYDKIYTPKLPSGEDCPIAIFGTISELAINFGKTQKTLICPKPREKFLKLLRTIESGLYVIGFSMDSAEKLTLHIFEYNGAQRSSEPIRSIKLASIKEMFENTVLT